MRVFKRYSGVFIGLFLALGANVSMAGQQRPTPPTDAASFSIAHRVGRIESDRLVECSGMDVSMANDDLLWAINDGGHGSFLFAMGKDGRDRGRVRVAEANNRDWEGMATFMWNGRPMLLIADIGDNYQRHATHTLYVVAEPLITGERFNESDVVPIAWRVVFSYPDRGHDGEGVAVDALREEILILTKRDDPPLLFTLPLNPSSSARPLVARPLAAVDRIPPPTDDDRRYPYGQFRSQPTALDLSPDGLTMAVLTYKHAYLFTRDSAGSWATAVGRSPAVIRLPLPQDTLDLLQREAICFSTDGRSLLVTSEGKHPGIYQLDAK